MKKLPDSYLSGTLTSGHGGGATVHLHFSSVDEAEQWFNGLTAESAEQREQGQAVALAHIETHGRTRTFGISETNWDSLPDGDYNLYTTPPTPPAGVPDGFINFARDVLADFPENFPDGFALQDLAVKHGLLVGRTVTEPCRDEGCACAGYCGAEEMADGVTCYRRCTALSAAPQPAAQTQEVPQPELRGPQ